jgi:hypothetical protein
MKPTDIFICSFLRQQYTAKTLAYLRERTKAPYRVWLLDNGGNEEFKTQVDFYIPFKENIGIHPVWQIAAGLAESDYFITSDNDIYVPDLRRKMEARVVNPVTKEVDSVDWVDNNTDFVSPCWLANMITLMDQRPNYGAISLHPHVIIGATAFDPHDPEDVKEVNMAGAVMRIMRRDAVYKAGGWERVVRASRNHEESTISSRLQTAGYKTGRTTRIRAYHPFGRDVEGNLGWGYVGVTPEQQGHRPEMAEYVKSFDDPDSYDQKTWLPLR